MPVLDVRVLSHGATPVLLPESATVRITAVDADGPRKHLQGADFVFARTTAIDIRDGAPVRDIDLRPTDGTFCYEVRISSTVGGFKLTRHITVPDAPGPIRLGDRPDVDPKTFQPTADVVAAWEGVVTEALAACTDAETAAQAADGWAESAHGDAVSAQSSARAASEYVDAADESALNAFGFATAAAGQAESAAASAAAAALARTEATQVQLNARSVDALISALDMRDPREIVIGHVGDSTADFADEWFETAFRELFASQWPDRPARLKRWNRSENQYPAAFTTWQSAEVPGTPSNPGGTFPGTVIASDGFARVGALVGSTMDVGSSAYTGTAGILTTDGDRLVTSATASAIVAAGMRPREGADFAAKVTMRVTSKATANRQVKWYAVRKDASNDVEIAYAGSTTITITVVVRVGGTARTVGTFPAGTIPSNTDPADYPFELSLSGSSLTAKVNGATLGPFALTTDEVTAVAGMTSTGFSSPGEPSWSADALEVRGTVVVAPSGGSAPVPSTLNYATVYNGAIAGSTIESQRTRLPQIMPQRPDLLVITHGHNYATATPEAFIAAIDGFLADLAAVHGPGIPVAVMSENPRFTGDANETAHRQRQVALRATARVRGWLYLPGFEAYARLADGGKSYINATDGVHPNPVGTTPSGARLQADAAKRALLAISERPV